MSDQNNEREERYPLLRSLLECPVPEYNYSFISAAMLRDLIPSNDYDIPATCKPPRKRRKTNSVTNKAAAKANIPKFQSPTEPITAESWFDFPNQDVQALEEPSTTSQNHSNVEPIQFQNWQLYDTNQNRIEQNMYTFQQQLPAYDTSSPDTCNVTSTSSSILESHLLGHEAPHYQNHTSGPAPVYENQWPNLYYQQYIQSILNQENVMRYCQSLDHFNQIVEREIVSYDNIDSTLLAPNVQYDISDRIAL